MAIVEFREGCLQKRKVTDCDSHDGPVMGRYLKLDRDCYGNCNRELKPWCQTL